MINNPPIHQTAQRDLWGVDAKFVGTWGDFNGVGVNAGAGGGGEVCA